MNILYFSVLYLFFFILSMLFHELMHVKSQGLRATGTVYIDIIGMRVTVNNIKNYDLLYFGGGILTGLVFLTFGVSLCLTNEPGVGYILLLTGICQVLYGLLEGFKLRIWGNGRKYLIARYTIYVLVPIAGYVLLIP